MKDYRNGSRYRSYPFITSVFAERFTSKDSEIIKTIINGENLEI